MPTTTASCSSSSRLRLAANRAVDAAKRTAHDWEVIAKAAVARAFHDDPLGGDVAWAEAAYQRLTAAGCPCDEADEWALKTVEHFSELQGESWEDDTSGASARRALNTWAEEQVYKVISLTPVAALTSAPIRMRGRSRGARCGTARTTGSRRTTSRSAGGGDDPPPGSSKPGDEARHVHDVVLAGRAA